MQDWLHSLFAALVYHMENGDISLFSSQSYLQLHEEKFEMDASQVTIKLTNGKNIILMIDPCCNLPVSFNAMPTRT